MLTKEVERAIHCDNSFLRILGAGIAAMGIFLAGAQAGRATAEHQKYDALIEKQNEMLRRYESLEDQMQGLINEQRYSGISATRSAGANSVSSTMLHAEVSGSGSQTVYAVFNGNMQIGDAGQDTHVIHGDLEIDGELHVRPDGKHDIFRVLR